jgi:hypothetical protein
VREQSSKLVFFVIFILYLASVTFGFLRFHLWSQVEYIHSTGLNIDLQSIYNHAHALRYALVYPIYWIAEEMGLDANFVFSVFVVFVFLIISLLLARSIAYFRRGVNLWLSSALVLVFLIALSMLMNGRLVFGFLAYSLMFYSVLVFLEKSSKRIDNRALILMTSALLISSVSSGISISLYLILFSFLGLYFIISFFNQTFKERSYNYLYLIVIFITYTPIMVLLISKNVNYYGGGIEGAMAMTQHGAIADSILEGRQLQHGPKEGDLAEGGLFGINIFNFAFMEYFDGLFYFINLFKILFALFTSYLLLFLLFFFRELAGDIKLFFIAYSLFSVITLSLFSNSILMMGIVPTLISVPLLYDALKLAFKNKWK